MEFESLYDLLSSMFYEHFMPILLMFYACTTLGSLAYIRIFSLECEFSYKQYVHLMNFFGLFPCQQVKDNLCMGFLRQKNSRGAIWCLRLWIMEVSGATNWWYFLKVPSMTQH